MEYRIVIPANTTASVTLPKERNQNEIAENNVPLDKAKGVVSYSIEEQHIHIELQSGSYVFTVKE